MKWIKWVSQSSPSPVPHPSPRSGFFIEEQQHLSHPHKQGRTFWRGDKPQRGVLLGPGSPVPTELHIKVQGHGSGGAETPLAARVPQRLLARRRVEEVSGYGKSLCTCVCVFSRVSELCLVWIPPPPPRIIKIDQPWHLTPAFKAKGVF